MPKSTAFRGRLRGNRDARKLSWNHDVKDTQWNAVKQFVGGIGLPHLVARHADGMVILPGSTDLNAAR
jgi:hypothetical protein